MCTLLLVEHKWFTEAEHSYWLTYRQSGSTLLEAPFGEWEARNVQIQFFSQILSAHYFGQLLASIHLQNPSFSSVYYCRGVGGEGANSATLSYLCAAPPLHCPCPFCHAWFVCRHSEAWIPAFSQSRQCRNKTNNRQSPRNENLNDPSQETSELIGFVDVFSVLLLFYSALH